jgi:hypothetical protein
VTDTFNAVKDAWAIILGVIGLVAWFVRLEARAMRNSDELGKETQSRKSELVALELRLEKQRQEDMTQRKEDRDTTNAMIRDVQSDIKLLLQRTAK